MKHHKHHWLTRDELNHLPDGTRVRIIWSGGNGPHEYIIRCSDDYPYAVLEDGVVVAPIYGIGKRQPLTQVELVSKAEAA